MDAQNTNETSREVWPASRVAWTTVVILTVAQFVNALDRYMINLLVDPIKSDLGVSDTQMGLLLGFAFAVFYTVMGVPLGRLADRYSRRLIIMCGLSFWSLATIACGFANSFKALFFTRMAVGAGEASLNPCGYSIISDSFPAERRAVPMGVFIMGASIGSATVLYLGGLVLEYLVDNNITWHVAGDIVLVPWQICFVLAGLPGFLVLLLLRLMQEPPRSERLNIQGTDSDTSQALPIGDVARYILDRWHTYGPMFIGFGLILMWSMGKSLWAPTFLGRSFGWSPSEIGLAMAFLMLGGNSLGVLCGGWVSQKVAEKGYVDPHLRTAYWGAIVGVPFAIAAPLMPTPLLSMLLLWPAFFFGAFPFSLAPAAISAITPNEMRAQITAIYLMTINLLGYGLGPALIGFINDRVFADSAMLGASMALSAVIAMPAGTVMLWFSMRAFRALKSEAAGAVA